MSRTCSVEGCGKPHDSKGYCHMHYNRWKRTGSALTPLQLSPDGSGWIQRGYRILTVDGRRVPEHVLVAERALGKALPAGAIVHHVDENPLNNIASNLVICPDHKYHHLLHQRMRALAACDNPNWKKCPYCGTYDDPAVMRLEQCGRSVHRECSANARRAAYKARRERGLLIQTGS